MLAKTSFGSLDFPINLATKQRNAVLRALSWCKELADLSDVWSKEVRDNANYGTALNREINGKTLSIYPLLAARLDAGLYTRQLSLNHLPVWLDGEKICIVSARGKGHDLHTDLVASLILLLGQEEPVLQTLPQTLRRASTRRCLAVVSTTEFLAVKNEKRCLSRFVSTWPMVHLNRTSISPSSPMWNGRFCVTTFHGTMNQRPHWTWHTG